MKVKRVEYNWVEGKSSFYEINTNNVVSISGKAPRVHGDAWNYYIIFKDGTAERVFNINKVIYYGKEKTI